MQYVIPKGKSSFSNSFSKPTIRQQLEYDCQAFPKCKARSRFSTNKQKSEGATYHLMCWYKADAMMSELLFPLQHWLSTNNNSFTVTDDPYNVGILSCRTNRKQRNEEKREKWRKKREMKKTNCFLHTPRATLMRLGHFYLQCRTLPTQQFHSNTVRDDLMFLWR